MGKLQPTNMAPPPLYPPYPSIETKPMASPPPPPKFNAFDSFLKKGKTQRSSSPDAEIRRMKTRLEKGESRQAVLADKLARTQLELKAAKEELSRVNNLDSGFRVLNLEDPKEKKLFETEEKLKLQHARETARLREEIVSLESELQSMEKMSSKESNQSKNKARNEMAAMRRDHDQEKMKMRREFEEQMEKMVHERQLLQNQEADKWQTQVYQMREQHQKDLTGAIQDYEIKVVSLEARLEKQENELRMTKADSDKIYDVTQKKHREEVTKLVMRYNELEDNYGRLTQELAVKSASTSELSKTEMKKLKEAHDDEMSRMAENLERERNAFEVKFAMQDDQYHRTIKDMEGKHNDELHTAIEQIKTQSLKELSHVNSVLDELQDQLDKRTAELRQTQASVDDEKKNTIAEYEVKIEMLVAQHENEIKTLRKQEDNDHAVRVAGWEAKLRKSEDQHQSEIHRLEHDHNNELASLAAEREKLVKKLDRYDHEEGHTRMLLDDERERRNKAVRRFQEAQKQCILLQEENNSLKEQIAAEAKG